MRLGRGLWFSGLLSTYLCLAYSCAALSDDSTDQMKARLGSAGAGDRPTLCIRISEQELVVASKLYAEGDFEKAQAALTDVAAFAEMARDYAVQSHKHEKQSEIALRKMVRKLSDLGHTLSHEDGQQVQKTIDRLERVRDDLMISMFPKASKK